ncbi:MAG: hypothetical protein R3C03_06545 [Pirellulaceae bacterium]
MVRADVSTVAAEVDPTDPVLVGMSIFFVLLNGALMVTWANQDINSFFFFGLPFDHEWRTGKVPALALLVLFVDTMAILFSRLSLKFKSWFGLVFVLVWGSMIYTSTLPVFERRSGAGFIWGFAIVGVIFFAFFGLLLILERSGNWFRNFAIPILVISFTVFMLRTAILGKSPEQTHYVGEYVGAAALSLSTWVVIRSYSIFLILPCIVNGFLGLLLFNGQGWDVVPVISASIAMLFWLAFVFSIQLLGNQTAISETRNLFLKLTAKAVGGAFVLAGAFLLCSVLFFDLTTAFQNGVSWKSIRDSRSMQHLKGIATVVEVNSTSLSLALRLPDNCPPDYLENLADDFSKFVIKDLYVEDLSPGVTIPVNIDGWVFLSNSRITSDQFDDLVNRGAIEIRLQDCELLWEATDRSATISGKTVTIYPGNQGQVAKILSRFASDSRPSFAFYDGICDEDLQAAVGSESNGATTVWFRSLSKFDELSNFRNVERSPNISFSITNGADEDPEKFDSVIRVVSGTSTNLNLQSLSHYGESKTAFWGVNDLVWCTHGNSEVGELFYSDLLGTMVSDETRPSKDLSLDELNRLHWIFQSSSTKSNAIWLPHPHFSELLTSDTAVDNLDTLVIEPYWLHAPTTKSFSSHLTFTHPTWSQEIKVLVLGEDMTFDDYSFLSAFSNVESAVVSFPKWRKLGSFDCQFEQRLTVFGQA